MTVGKMAHVAAGSVVTKNVEPYMRVAGNPARPIRNLLTNERISR
jgi:acetyltransferase-like isoleucine patch superfamily enzyme